MPGLFALFASSAYGMPVSGFSVSTVIFMPGLFALSTSFLSAMLEANLSITMLITDLFAFFTLVVP